MNRHVEYRGYVDWPIDSFIAINTITGGIFNQQTPGGGLFANTATNQLGTGGGSQLGGGLFNASAGRAGGLGGLFNSQTPQHQQQPGRMFNVGAQTTGGLGVGLGQGGGLFQSPLGGGTGLGTGGGGNLTLGTNQGEYTSFTATRNVSINC